LIKTILDFRKAASPGDIHGILERQMNFPSYYGGNLNALYDCLTDICEDVCVCLFMPRRDGTEGADILPYLEKVRRVFLDAEEENDHLAVFFGDRDWSASFG
jgi:RNAse (barnase) inhibitor barstar